MNVSKILRWLRKVLLCLGLGYCLIFIIFRICQGPGWFFNMGDGYEMHRWPGSLYYFKYRENGVEAPIKHREYPFKERVVAFRIEGPWLVGKTDKGWFAIQKLKHKTYYPLVSEYEVVKITGLNIESFDLVTDPTTSLIFPAQYELIRPWTPKAVAVVVILYLPIVIICVLGRELTKKLFCKLFKWRIKPSAPL